MREYKASVVLYVGVLHLRDEEDDFVDIQFITTSKDKADDELNQLRVYATKTLKLKCVVERDDYILFKSPNERTMLEAFAVERLLIMKERKNEEN